jgi:hypothetical protein
MIRLGFACLVALLATAGCGSSAPTPTPGNPTFVLDSWTASCANELVGVDLAVEHALARPGYLDCITVTLRADPNGTMWVCDPVRDAAGPVCEGRQMELSGPDVDRIQATWHTAPEATWSDPVQLLGRVRFL